MGNTPTETNKQIIFGSLDPESQNLGTLNPEAPMHPTTRVSGLGFRGLGRKITCDSVYDSLILSVHVPI